MGEEAAIVTQAFQEGKPVVVENFAQSPLISERLRQRYHFVQDMWSAPMLSGTDVVGVLSIGYFTSHKATAEKLRVLQLLADEAALAVERARLVEALRKSEAQLRAQYQSLPLPTTTWQRVGEDFVLLDYNAAAEAFTRGHLRALVGTKMQEFFEEPELRADFIRCVTDQTTVKRECSYRLKSTGESKQLVFSFVFVAPSMVMIHAEDITARKQAEAAQGQLLAELQRVNAEFEQFGYIVSHDLNEPLRTITTYVQLLAQRARDKLDVEANEFIEFAVDGAQRLQGLIADLLAYTRAGGPREEFTAVDGDALLGRVLTDLQITITESGAAITHDPLPIISGDARRLGQVLQNLLTNALKFRGPAPPRVHVSAQRQGKEWMFSVRDNGIGLEPGHAERIFQVFQRLHPRQEYPGTGMGLAICKKIVERHGGRIWVESEPSKGATFFFTLAAL